MKFKDADLVGIPLRIVIGRRGLKEGKLEAKWRWEKDSTLIDLADAAKPSPPSSAKRRDNARFRGRANS